MNLSSSLIRLERQQRGTACPMCARGLGVRPVVIAVEGNPPQHPEYTCPICDAVPVEVRVVYINLGEDLGLSPKQRAVASFLAAGPADHRRVRAMAALSKRGKPTPRSAAAVEVTR